MRGRAAVARAEYELQIIELEAQARLRAEILNAEAEIVRAEGIREAMYIISEGLCELYLYHFWIRTMAEHANIGIIYGGKIYEFISQNRNFIRTR